MSRFFAPITKEELAQKIYDAASNYHKTSDDVVTPSFIEESAYELGLDTLTAKVTKDLSKVSFDTENLDAESLFRGMSLIGFNSLDNGMTFLGVQAGGDWECPVFFIIYWDGTDLRGYIPSDGNTWNTDTKEAYGNNETADDKNCQKRFGKDYEEYMDVGDFDMVKIEADIKSRILPKGGAGVQAPTASKKIRVAVVGAGSPPNFGNMNKTILETVLMEIDSMQANLDSMKKALNNVLKSM